MLGLVCVGFILPSLVASQATPAATEPNLEVFPTDRMLNAGCSLAEFCWFCCLLPKNESHLPTRRRDGLETLGNGALRSEMPCHVMPSPSSGADPDELVECARERCLVIKSRLNRDVDQRHA